MRTRRFFAAAVLAAVTLCVGALDAPPPQFTADEATAQHVIEHPGTAQFYRAVGWGWRASWALSRPFTAPHFSTRFVIAL